MKFNELKLSGAYLIELETRGDNRGWFSRYYCENEYKEFGLDTNIVQANVSYNEKLGTLRGLHFQRPPKAEVKIVRCLHGAIWDVIVDIRKSSGTFGKWFGQELNEDNRLMMYVPKGFAHGFITLSDFTEILYLHTEFYDPALEDGINYNDKSLDIDWPIDIKIVSKRDKYLGPLSVKKILNELPTL
jgi:dTDP-4-dehydrorhamnose 3,5-epimerase